MNLGQTLDMELFVELVLYGALGGLDSHTTFFGCASPEERGHDLSS